MMANAVPLVLEVFMIHVRICSKLQSGLRFPRALLPETFLSRRDLHIGSMRAHEGNIHVHWVESDSYFI